MNKNRLLQRWHIGCALLAALFMVSCSQDEALEQGTALPEGKYPLELTASIGEATATPATRGTVHGEWPYNGYLKIASSIEYPNGVNWDELLTQSYSIDANGGITFNNVYGIPTTIYWRRSDEKLYIYAGSTTLAVDGSTWDVKPDQSKENDLNYSDYLTAYEVLTFGGEHKLTFRHLTSKITINIKESDYLTAHKDDVSVALVTKGEQWYTEGNFKGDVSEITLFAEGDNLQQTEQITPYRNDNLQTAGIYATYEAVLIPQQITGTSKAIQIKVGDATYYYTLECSKDKFSSGEEWTYDILVRDEELRVESIQSNIDWDTDNGATGEGNVEIQ